VKDVADVHKTLWPEQNQRETILNVAVLTGKERPQKIRPDDESSEDRIEVLRE
jgi:hypothetical protein